MADELLIGALPGRYPLAVFFMGKAGSGMVTNGRELPPPRAFGLPSIMSRLLVPPSVEGAKRVGLVGGCNENEVVPYLKCCCAQRGPGAALSRAVDTDR